MARGKGKNRSQVPDERMKALQAALQQIQRTHGEGTVMRLGEVRKQQVDVIPSGSLGLDIAMGIGGYPRGRIVEIYGTEASGKTTLALHAIAEAQKMGGIAAFIDAEHAMDPGYAEKLGVQLDNLVVSQPDTGEQALDIVEKLVQSGAVDLVVIDSVAALVPRSEIEGTIDDQSVGVQARLMSRAIRRLTGVVSRSNTCVIFINQVRHKIQAYGNPETTPGGLALKFAASVRLSVHARQSPIQEKGQAVGSEVTVKVVKNKLAPPYRVARFDILYGKGISRLGELIDLGLQYEVVRRSGSWYSYGDLQLGQGRENARKYLEEHPDLAQEIERKIREKAGLLPEAEGGKP